MRNRDLRTEFLYNFVKKSKIDDIVIQLQYLDVLDKQNARLICMNKELSDKLDRIISYLNTSVYLKNNIDPQTLLEQLDLIDLDEEDKK